MALFWQPKQRVIEPTSREPQARKQVTRSQPRIRAAVPAPSTDWTPPDGWPDLSEAKVISIDCETWDPELKTKGPGVRRNGYVAGVALATDCGHRFYFPVRHDNDPQNLDPAIVFNYLQHELGRNDQTKVGLNLLYDLDYLASNDVWVEGKKVDVGHMDALLDENEHSYSLNSIAHRRLGEHKEEQQLIDWICRAFGVSEDNAKNYIAKAPAQLVGPYAEKDAELPLKLYQTLLPKIEADDLTRVFDIECRLIPMLLEMRQCGVPVDVAGAERLRDQLKKREEEAHAKIRHLVGKDVDVWSAESVARLFDALGQPYPRTAKGRPSFTKEWLKHQNSQAANLVNDARHLSKMISTFIEGYILEGHVNGRVHGEFHQMRGDEGGTITGRFSSSNPNLQNIPARTEIGKMIRALFQPFEGWQWWKRDWSQIEYRLIVHFSNLMNLPRAADAADAYRNDPSTDFHKWVAEICKISRQEAKSINFGLSFGMGEPALAGHLGIPLDDAKPLFEQYHSAVPFVRALYRSAQSRANQMGYIRTVLGRRGHYDWWECSQWVDAKERAVDPDKWKPVANRDLAVEKWGGRVRRAFTNTACNKAVQGSAADLMKTAMVTIYESGVCSVLGVPFLTVHDELDGAKPPTKAGDEAMAEVTHIMETCIKLSVPIRAEGTEGPNWGSV